MLGGMLAGHDQSGGEIIEKDGKKKKLFYGMSSATAMTKHKGGVAEYRLVKIRVQLEHCIIKLIEYPPTIPFIIS
jgi:IMP dehydrogenase/GMP reductase